MARPGNQHRANCIGTLLFLISSVRQPARGRPIRIVTTQRIVDSYETSQYGGAASRCDATRRQRRNVHDVVDRLSPSRRFHLVVVRQRV